MLNCKEASEKMSQSLDRRLSISEQIGVRFHLLICKGCAQFHNHMMLLRKTLVQFSQADSFETTGPALSSDARMRIKQALQQKSTK